MSTESPYRDAVLACLREWGARRVLDFPCGTGWLAQQAGKSISADGLDLFASAPASYQKFARADMDQGIPAGFAGYDAIVSCEAIAYLTRPGIFFCAARDALAPGGRLLVTTPNAAFAASRLVFMLRGFFLGYRAMPGVEVKTDHMPLIPWNYPQLHHHLSLAGFDDIRLHPLDDKSPKHRLEYLLGWPQSLYCGRQALRATSALTQAYWRHAGSRSANYGRRLVVSARRAAH